MILSRVINFQYQLPLNQYFPNDQQYFPGFSVPCLHTTVCIVKVNKRDNHSVVNKSSEEVNLCSMVYDLSVK